MNPLQAGVVEVGVNVGILSVWDLCSEHHDIDVFRRSTGWWHCFAWWNCMSIRETRFVDFFFTGVAVGFGFVLESRLKFAQPC